MYATTIWEPHTQKDITSLEKVQRHAARFVCDNYSRFASVSEIISYLSWPTLLQCRKEQKAVIMFKFVHNLVDIPADKLLLPISTAHCTRRGHHMRFIQPAARIDYYSHSFFPSSIKIWNSIFTQICH